MTFKIENAKTVWSELDPVTDLMIKYWRGKHREFGRDSAIGMMPDPYYLDRVARRITYAAIVSGGGRASDFEMIYWAIYSGLLLENKARTDDHRKPKSFPGDMANVLPFKKVA